MTQPNQARPDLRLYVAGTNPRSLRAVQNVKRICDAAFGGRYELEIIDAYKQPGRLAQDNIIAIPTLVRLSPGGPKRLVGDLSIEANVRKGLGLQAA